MTSPSKIRLIAISDKHLAAEIRTSGHQLPDYSEGSLFVVCENDKIATATGNMINVVDDRINPTRIQFRSLPQSFQQVSENEVRYLLETFQVIIATTLDEAQRRLAVDTQLAGRDNQASRGRPGAAGSAAALA